ncbi:hypothetical protein AXF42_Ash001677 [Apostasia shenzhenica]|uniref:RNA polymerase II subunit 5-mediating protein like n=1 Tax=Apostasia shenzhenica TaxID=1088818 RepID=A0A2I0AB05_9ASPA|nr:hypothetical protein AXF42_Ash001677 [Apostasia shenzhenica]
MEANDMKMGTVTPLGSLFTHEEADKASRWVGEVIANRQKELRLLFDFISDNSALVHLIRKLPYELSHDIMVPFGGAAFFPGHLIHTNEFFFVQVLLGDGYYAERSAKQTVEILQRRGKSLEAQVESLKKTVRDLEAEAKFFDSTAAEVAEGLVEIREDYVEETQSKKIETNVGMSRKVGYSEIPGRDDEHIRLMARLDELEKEAATAAAETVSPPDIDENDDDDDDDAEEEEDNEDEEEDDERIIAEVHEADDDGSDAHEADETEDDEADELVDINAKKVYEEVSSSKMQVASREASLKSDIIQQAISHNPSLPPEMNEYSQKSQIISESIADQSSKSSWMERKAFTGSVIEHGHGLLPAQPPKDSTSNERPSRPVSKFKLLQKANR